MQTIEISGKLPVCFEVVFKSPSTGNLYVRERMQQPNEFDPLVQQGFTIERVTPIYN